MAWTVILLSLCTQGLYQWELWLLKREVLDTCVKPTWFCILWEECSASTVCADSGAARESTVGECNTCSFLLWIVIVSPPPHLQCCSRGWQNRGGSGTVTGCGQPPVQVVASPLLALNTQVWTVGEHLLPELEHPHCWLENNRPSQPNNIFLVQRKILSLLGIKIHSYENVCHFFFF